MKNLELNNFSESLRQVIVTLNLKPSLRKIPEIKVLRTYFEKE